MPEASSVAVKYPHVSKIPRIMAKSSDYEFIRKATREYEEAWAANEQEFHNLFEAWKFAFAGKGEQWDWEAWKYKMQKGQRAGQYNFLGAKLQTYTGTLQAEKYDERYDPIDGVRNSGIEAIENAYYTDKERCEYQDHWNLLLQDAVVHLGVLQCKVSTKYDKRGNIIFERALPGRWVFDPYWKTDFDRDCEKSWKQGHLTIPQLFEQFGSLPNTPELDTRIRHLKKMGMSWTSRMIDEYNKHDPVFTDTYQVIETHWVETIKTKRLIWYDEQGNATPFPVTTDNEKLEQFAMEKGITDWQDGVDVVPYDDKVHWSATMCPDLFPYQLIEYGKPEIQVGGLPTIQLTMHRDISGRNKGVAADLIDPQKDINYNKSKVQEYLAQALGGSIVYNKQAMPGNTQQSDFEANRNDPSRSFPIDGNPGDFMRHVNDAQINPSVTGQVMEGVDFMDRISGKSAAMESQTQSSSEPAALFEMKLQVDKIGDLPVLGRMKRARIRRAEMYFLQAQISYAGPERRFTSKDGKREAVLNEKVVVQGRPGIRNKVEDIPISSVTIEEAPDNLSRQMRTRSEMGTILKTVEPLGYRETAAIVTGELIRSTNLPEDKMEKVDQAIKMEQVSARVAKMAEMAQMAATIAESQLVGAQAKAELQMLMQQMGGGGEQPPAPDQISPDQTQPQGMEGEAEPVPEQVSMEEEMVPDQGMVPETQGVENQPTI